MKYVSKYMKNFAEILNGFGEDQFEATIKQINQTKLSGDKLIFVGNGGSAAMASHLSVDFTKACNIRSICFNEADLLTCLSNDFGYENWVVEALRFYADAQDLVFLISSSGTSANITNAADYCNEAGLKLITLSGFSSDNPLAVCGAINLHIPSQRYNYVEMAHHTWLVALVDRLSIDAD